jgi:hypothetical protein
MLCSIETAAKAVKDARTNSNIHCFTCVLPLLLVLPQLHSDTKLSAAATYHSARGSLASPRFASIELATTLAAATAAAELPLARLLLCSALAAAAIAAARMPGRAALACSRAAVARARGGW